MRRVFRSIMLGMCAVGQRRGNFEGSSGMGRAENAAEEEGIEPCDVVGHGGVMVLLLLSGERRARCIQEGRETHDE